MGHRFRQQQKHRQGKEPVQSHWHENMYCIVDAIDDFYRKMSSAQHIFDHGMLRDGAAVDHKEEAERMLRSQDMQDALDRMGRLIQSWLETDVPELRNLFDYYWPRRYSKKPEILAEAPASFNQKIGEMENMKGALAEFSSRLKDDNTNIETLLRSGLDLAFTISYSKVRLTSISAEVTGALRSIQNGDQSPSPRK